MEGMTFLVHETGIGWDQENLKIFHPVLQNFRSFSIFEEPKDKVTLVLASVQLFLNFPQNKLSHEESSLSMGESIHN